MDIHTFIGNYREAFGQQAELPIVFWYSDQPEAPAEKVNGCFRLVGVPSKKRKNNQPQCRNNRLWRRQVLHRLHGYAGTCARLRLFEREIQENTRYGY